MTGLRVLLLSVALGLALGVGSPRSATHASTARALSFATATGVVARSPSKASVLVDTGSGKFLRVKRQGTRVAVADAIGDLNGDGKPDLVTHYNSSEDGEGITVAREVSMYASRLSPGKAVRHDFGAGRGGYLYLISGALTANDAALRTGDAAYVTGSGSLELTATDTSDLLVVDTPLA